MTIVDIYRPKITKNRTQIGLSTTKWPQVRSLRTSMEAQKAILPDASPLRTCDVDEARPNQKVGSISPPPPTTNTLTHNKCTYIYIYIR